jgi:alpha-glucosidase
MKKIYQCICILIVFATGCTNKVQDVAIKLDKDEFVWCGVINDGHFMPLENGYKMDFYGRNKVNQINPVILTSKGQYIWSEEPFAFELLDNQIIIKNNHAKVQAGKHGETLAEVYRHVSGSYFPASGKMPDRLLFAAPQYNTWIELNYNHNQSDILKYAQAIIDNGLPPGVFMIDDTWQEDYGLWDFHPGRFPNPKLMINQLHKMGFKVMLWVCPFVSADQKLLYYELKDKKALMLEKENPTDTWETAKHPAMIRWWNGVSAELDFSNPEAVNWFNAQLDRLVRDYNIDGFKFDAADLHFYPANTLSKGNISPNKQAEIYARIGLRFPLNEYRACWKMAGQPLAQRLHDKKHNWEDLRRLIPLMITEGLSGYTFACPDMIGGGLLETFKHDSLINQELVVRSAQCHALMPMMQFSAAPWRILDKEHLNAVKEAVNLRMKFTPQIMKLAQASALSGEPILKSMEFVFPHQGFAKVVDQFMLGDSILVCPMLVDGTSVRKVDLPNGKWTDDQGNDHEGGQTITVEVPLNRLPYFILNEKLSSE